MPLLRGDDKIEQENYQGTFYCNLLKMDIVKFRTHFYQSLSNASLPIFKQTCSIRVKLHFIDLYFTLSNSFVSFYRVPDYVFLK